MWDPIDADAYVTRGNALRASGKLDEAAECYRQALRLRPDWAGAYGNLGGLRLAQGRLDDALACFQKAVQIEPNSAVAHYHLGVLLQTQKKPDAAAASYRRALQLAPENAEAHNALGVTLLTQGSIAEAIAEFRRSLQLQPNSADFYHNLGSALKEQGCPAEAAEAFRQALALGPNLADAHSGLLLAEHHRPGVTLAGLAAEHAAWDRQFAAPLKGLWRPWPNSRDPDRSLRLGFVSGDFAQHPVGFLCLGAVEALRRSSACHVVCYNSRKLPDGFTARFQAAAGTWREVQGVSDETLAEQIRADAIDILFDLSGHTAGNRLLAFARKPAPRQIAWAGYPGTTGLEAMNSILADRHQIPPGAERHYREKVLRGVWRQWCRGQGNGGEW